MTKARAASSERVNAGVTCSLVCGPVPWACARMQASSQSSQVAGSAIVVRWISISRSFCSRQRARTLAPAPVQATRNRALNRLRRSSAVPSRSASRRARSARMVSIRVAMISRSSR